MRFLHIFAHIKKNYVFSLKNWQHPGNVKCANSINLPKIGKKRQTWEILGPDKNSKANEEKNNYIKSKVFSFFSCIDNYKKFATHISFA